ELALDFLPRRRDAGRRRPLADDVEIVEAAAHELLESRYHVAGSARGEAALKQELRLVQGRMGRTRMVDSHQRPIIEADHQVAGIADGADAAEGNRASEQDHDAE